jgi:hypothetical protein
MDKQFENMQKLAFGKILIKESMRDKMTKSQMKEKIREIILNEYNSPQIDEIDLDEAKKKKAKDVMPQDPEAEVPEVPTTPDEVPPSDNTSFDVPQSPTTSNTMSSPQSITPEQKDIHSHLMSAYDSALKSGDEKLITQIRNTIQFLNKTMLDGGQQAVAEGILLEHDMDILNDIEGDLMNSDMSEEERIGYLNDIIDYCRMEKEKILQQLNETNT